MSNEGQKCLLNTDWMGLSLIIDSEIKGAPKGHQWREYENGTNVWKTRRVLYSDRGDKVCTLLSNPKSRLLDRRCALLEIENEWLYHGIGVRGIEQMLTDVCLFSVRGMSRMDLAVDFVPTAAQVEVIKKLATNEYRVQGKGNMVPWWATIKGDWVPRQYAGQFLPYDVSWGHKTSDVKWKCYYKSKELKDAVGGIGWDKPYIVDQWREAGFDVANVWRLEVSIRNCNGIMYNGHKLTQDVWGNHTVALMRDLYSSRFVVRKNEGHKDKTNDTIVDFLPIEGSGLVRCRTYDGEREHHGRIALLRRLVQSLDDEQVLLDEESREGVLEHIRAIIRRDALQNYFKGMVGDYFEVWRDKVREDAGVTLTNGGRYDVLREHNAGVDISPNMAFEEEKQTHAPAHVKLTENIKNWRTFLHDNNDNNKKLF